MKPTLQHINLYREYLIKQNLIDTVHDYLSNSENLDIEKNFSIEKLKFSGDYEYDDEGGNYFCLDNVAVVLSDSRKLEFGYDDDKLLDRCSVVSTIIYDELTIVIADHKEPFNLQVVD
jgi:hypothetical protein